MSNDTMLGFFDPEKIVMVSLDAHRKMVEAGEITKEELPVFGIKRMTGEDVILLEDNSIIEETNPLTGMKVSKIQSGKYKLAMLCKYWVSATNFKIGNKDLSFDKRKVDILRSKSNGDLEKFMEENFKYMSGELINWLYSQIRFGSYLTEEEIKN